MTLAYDRDLIDKLGTEAKASAALHAKLEERKLEADSRRQALTGAEEAVRGEADKKKEVLASLRQEKESRLRALKELEQAAVRLQKMLDDLTKQASIRPPDLSS